MNSMVLITTALRAMFHHIGRSLLTTLGITIGVASLVAMLALGSGAKEKMSREILAIGNNSIYISAGNIMDIGKASKKKSIIKPLTNNDVHALKQQCPLLAYASLTTSRTVVCEYQGASASIELKAGNHELFPILNRKMSSGFFFTELHNQKSIRVIVMGSKATSQLFGFSNPLGKNVIINNIPFVVIGVLQPLENQMSNPFYDANNDCFIPFTAYKKYIEKSYNDHGRDIIASTYRAQDMPTAVIQCSKILKIQHNKGPHDPNDFTIFDQQSMLNAAKKSADIFTLFLFFVAAIALLVGGIGVMNIMSVTVQERTKEIGIRMAIGATQKNILLQFLYESLLLCLAGGILGIALGTIIPLIIAKFTGWGVIITPLSIVIAFGAMMAVGIIFGFYPAYKAANLNPVQALEDR
ncbi:MAG: Export ABC transporter permease protein [candidate division TM6 bacterium GW2011_GWF2_38_10]|nr:MAG: Export ABC transporter permease protein [candidate division TM6 bacterium GW2011_GWF2_38_10]